MVCNRGRLFVDVDEEMWWVVEVTTYFTIVMGTDSRRNPSYSWIQVKTKANLFSTRILY